MHEFMHDTLKKILKIAPAILYNNAKKNYGCLHFLF